MSHYSENNLYDYNCHVVVYCHIISNQFFSATIFVPHPQWFIMEYLLE